MQIHYLRDIPLLLGAIAMLVAIVRPTPEPSTTRVNSEEADPQWICRAVFYFVGFVLIGFGVLGNYTPH